MGDGSNVARTAGRVLVIWCGLALAVASMTVLFLGMRAVMEVGGTCASGGPYTIETTCPKGAAWMVPVSIWTGLIGIGAYAIASMRLPGPRLALLAWPGLFLSLGWNFLEFGLGGESVAIGWIICGVVFVLMGGLPLAGVLGSATARRALFWADGPLADDTMRPRQALSGVVPTMPRIPQRRPTNPIDDLAGPSTDGDSVDDLPADLTSRLERLATLHRRGDLSAQEYAEAKARVLQEGGR